MIGTILLWILIIILLLLGLVGIILPFLPGVPLIFIGSFIYAMATDFREITANTIILFFALTILCLVLDYVSGLIGAKKFGATKLGILGALLGMIVGLIAFGLPGIIIGSFLGAVILEILGGQKRDQAIKIGIGTLVGFLAGTLFKFIIGFFMIGAFIYQLIF